MAAYKIDGLDDCLKCLDAAPDNVVKMTKVSMREAGKKTARIIRSRTPGRFRRIVGYKVQRGDVSKNLYTLVGYFNKGKKKSSDKEIADWFKAYWKNYGTLTRRDASHHFEYPVKGRVRTRRNNVGQPAENFFEQAIEGWEGESMKAFEDEMVKQQDKLYDR